MRKALLTLTALLSTTLCASSQARWIPTLEDTLRASQCIDCVDSINCLITGKQNLSSDIIILKTTDGGRTFERFQLPQGPVSIGVPENIVYTSIDTAYLLAEHGQVFRSIDGGQSWEVISVIRDLPLRHFTPMQFRTSLKAVVAARGIPETPDSVDIVYRTNDGGQSWSRETLPSPPVDSMTHPMSIHDFESGRTSAIWYSVGSRRHYFSTKAAESDTWRHVEFPESRGIFHDFVCISESTYYLTYMVQEPRLPQGLYAYSLVHRSTDYGETWETVFNGLSRDTTLIADLDFRDSATALAASIDRAYRTTDGGNTWTEEVYSPPPWHVARVVASYPQGSDGIILTGGLASTHVYLPARIGDVSNRLRHSGHLMNAQLSPIGTGNSTGYFLTFESPDGAGVRIQLYDLLGSALFSAEYETTVGSNRIVVELPPHSSSAGFLRILSDGGDVTFPILLGL